MGTCYGGHSAYLCQACLDLKRRRYQRKREKAGYEPSNVNQTRVNQPIDCNNNLADTKVESSPITLSQYQRLVVSKNDKENDTELAMLATKHLFFSTSDDREQRENTKDSFETRWCALCFLSFYSMRERDDHIKQDPIRHISCPFCRDPTIYPTRDALAKQHDCTHRTACRYCAVPCWWPNRAAWKVHMIREHWMCIVCDEGEKAIFLDGEALRKHKRLEHSAVYCAWCDKIFESRVEKDRHMGIKHPSCRCCGLSFREPADQLRHLAFFCHFCKIALGSPKERNSHMRAQHAGKCEDCTFFSTHPSGEKYCDVHSAAAADRPNTTPPSLPEPQPSPNANTPELYAILQVKPSSSVADIVKAARRRRIETHPDRLERRGDLSVQEKEMIREQAKRVGFAADILSDTRKRREYDEETRSATRRKQRKWWKRFRAEDPFEWV